MTNALATLAFVNTIRGLVRKSVVGFAVKWTPDWTVDCWIGLLFCSMG